LNAGAKLLLKIYLFEFFKQDRKSILIYLYLSGMPLILPAEISAEITFRHHEET